MRQVAEGEGGGYRFPGWTSSLANVSVTAEAGDGGATETVTPGSLPLSLTVSVVYDII